MSLIEALAAVALLALAAVAATSMLLAASRDGAAAAREGRTAEAVLRVADGIRARSVAGDSGTVRIAVRGELFIVRWSRLHGFASEGLSVHGGPSSGGAWLRLGPTVRAP